MNHSLSARQTPPYRADQVGSLLRPPGLKTMRERFEAGAASADALRRIEDETILEAVAKQEQIGLRSVTDGEFRRASFQTDFLGRISGVEIKWDTPAAYEGGRRIKGSPPRPVVTGRLQWPDAGIEVAGFRYLQGITRATAKLCIPSPTMAHFRGGRAAIDAAAYPDLEDFFADLTGVFQEEIAALGKAGCRYLQLDDTNLAYLCDEKMRARVRERGDDPDALPHLYATLINGAIEKRPADMTVTVHLCRGNSRGRWFAEGGYEPVAEALFNEIAVDGFFLEYDDERSGDFSPLRYVPKGKAVVLGLVTTKRAELEDRDELRRRIEEASGYVELDQLCLSPQCGFSSHIDGHVLTEDQQWAKLRLVVATAREIWG